jgi:hypothetical protein
MLSPEDVHNVGLTQVHMIKELPSDFKASGHRIKYGRFRYFYGVDPKTCIDVMSDIQTLPQEARIVKPELQMVLMTLEWFNTNKGNLDFVGLYQICEKTVEKYLWIYARAIAALKERKVCFRREDGAIEARTVDCLHIPIREPRKNPSAKFCSPKMKRPALSYEVCLIAGRQQVAWVNGPFPAGTTDLLIYRMPGGLKSQLQDGEYLFADRGYRGEQETLRIRNPFDTDAVKESKRRSLARQETFNARIKNFKILDQPFKRRHEQDGISCFDKHQIIVHAIIVLLQYDMENGHLLFTV